MKATNMQSTYSLKIQHVFNRLCFSHFKTEVKRELEIRVGERAHSYCSLHNILDFCTRKKEGMSPIGCLRLYSTETALPVVIESKTMDGN